MSLEFKRVLCPVDLSEFSLEALKLAVNVAEASAATLDILHVIRAPCAVPGAYGKTAKNKLTGRDPAEGGRT
jgi:nucleotide-binding universal stress UspA family protein